MLKKDNLRFGLLIGFIVPLLGSAFYYLLRFRNIATVKEFLWYITNERALFTAMVSILMVVNIAIFTYYINTRKDRTAKGIFAMTCLYGLSAIVWKLFF